MTRGLNEYQKVNHFLKSSEITRKDKLARVRGLCVCVCVCVCVNACLFYALMDSPLLSLVLSSLWCPPTHAQVEHGANAKAARGEEL